MRLIVVLLAASLFTACSSATAPLEVDTQAVPARHVPLVHDAVRALLDACTRLEEVSADLDQVSAFLIEGTPETDYRSEQYGWRHYIALDIRVSDTPRAVPRNVRAAGHTITYYLGGGSRPGILTQKLVGQQLCGTMPLNASADSFLDAPALSLVDALD
jgi:hypothetical protein